MSRKFNYLTRARTICQLSCLSYRDGSRRCREVEADKILITRVDMHLFSKNIIITLSDIDPV